jgi:lipid-A-disaccharide synthase
MTIYFVAGEASGDNHGAALMASLRKLSVDLNFAGRGGPQMRALAGNQFTDWLDQAAVLGLWEVIRKYGYFRREFRQAVHEVGDAKPDAVILIDYPGFNLRLARALRQKFPAQKLIYYISPQVWAWNRGRIEDMARYLDLMLCIFPFEAELYNRSGLRTQFVGHPMIDRLRSCQIDIKRDPNLIGLFPGSRRREIRQILPIMIETARQLLTKSPELRFEVAAASTELAAEIREITKDSHAFTIRVGEAPALMQRAFVGIIASGSATLEAAYFRLPFALVYRVAWPTYVAGRIVVKVEYLGMPNVLADEEVVPEFIQHRARPKAIADTVTQLLNDAAARRKMISEFDTILPRLGQGGASDRAAQTIVNELQHDSLSF